MSHRPSVILLVFSMSFVLALPTAQGRNRCMDAEGKVTDQPDLCPGKSASARPGMSAPASVVEADIPPVTQPSGPSSQALWQEYTDMEYCAGDFDSYGRSQVIGRKGGWFQELLVGANKDGWRDRWFGKFFVREGEEHDEWLQKWHKRFLGKCAKFGFTAQPDEASAARNTKLSDELKEKMPEKRAQIDRAQKRERDYREASAPKAPDPGRAARCASEAKQIAEAKAALPQIPAREQAKLLREMAEAEEQYQLECSR